MAMNARRGARALTLLILTLSGALGLAAGPARAATHHHVVIRQYAYSPAALSLRAGDTVTWTNEDTVGHDVSVTRGPETFRSPMLSKGQSWSHTFGTAGSYAYVCSVHPDMRGTVTVAPAPTTPKSTQPAVQSPTQPATQSSTQAAGRPVTAPTTPAPRTRARATPKPAGKPAVAAPAVAAPVVQEAVATGTGATLDPLLVVAGISAAVTIFCLLLLVGRPATDPDGANAREP
jgi:plastocyanin